MDAGAWLPFFTAQVGAAAALSGLVIVAISINLARILSFPNLPGRAAETLVVLVGSLVLSSMMLMPGEVTMLGTVCLAIAAVVWGGSTAIQVSAFDQRAVAPRGSFVSRVALTQITTLSMLAGSALLASASEAGFFWLAASALLAIAGAVFATWVLLVEILR